MKSQGLAKLDKQLPRAASCLVIVYYGSDWELGTDTSQLPSGCKRTPVGVEAGPSYNKAGWNDQVEHFRHLLFQMCFHKVGKGHGWNITVHSWILSLFLTSQRWDSFSRFDLYPPHNLERTGTEWGFNHLPNMMTTMQINAVIVTTCNPGLPTHPQALVAESSQPKQRACWGSIEVGILGITVPLYLTGCPVWP